MHEGHVEPTAASDSFFIVYSAKEESFAERLHNTLQKHGVRCWLDPRGDSDDNGVTGQIAPRGFRVWDRVLLCATRSTLSSDWMSLLVDSVKRREEAARNQPNFLATQFGINAQRCARRARGPTTLP